MAPELLALPPVGAPGLLKGLNRQQRRAVTHATGPALVIAGPGTGKTEVVTRRVAWLIATRRARPREILALTFTDNAAREMQARVDVLVPYGQADAAIHTFHAFGDRLLREHSFELGLPSDVRLLSRVELIVLLRAHLFDLGLERYRPLGDPTRFLGALVDLFARAKDEDLTPAQLASSARDLRSRSLANEPEALLDVAGARDELARAYDAYCRLLAAQGAIDHSDQVSLALRLLRERPAVRREIRARYRYLVIDELQDTNRAQIEFVLALCGEDANVVAVGDPDQGIYGFRGARAGNVQRFAQAFADARRITLRRNYRSTSAVLEVAARVVSVAPDVGEARGQFAHRRVRGRPVRHISFATPDAEADGVALEIEQRLEAGARPRDFAVLVRSNFETDDFVRSLAVRGIPVDSGSRVRLTDVPAVRSLVAFLRVVANVDDSLELYILAAAEPYRLGGAQLSTLLNGARRRNRPLFEALSDASDTGDERLDEASRGRVALLVGHVRHALALASDSTSGEVLYDYLRRSGRLARMARGDDAHGADEARSVARFCELVRGRASLLAADRVAFLAAALELSEPDSGDAGDIDDGDAVRVLTVHRAKGLEFKTVYVSGLVEGRFPVKARPATLSLPDELIGDADADEDRALAEERRLFFVAVTRACDELVLTSHENGRGGRGRRRPSIFIAQALDAPPAAALPPVGRGSGTADLARVLLPAPDAQPAQQMRNVPLTLSFSQLDEYLTCPERYRLRYDIGIPTPAHHALSYGNAIHGAIAAFHGAQARGQTMTDAELIAELRRCWQPDGYLSREHEDARFAAGAQALHRFRAQELARGGHVPAAVEKPFSFRLGQDIIRGRIDRIDATDQGVVITDYKSSDVRDQKRADVRARDSLQLQVYALAHEAQSGQLPSHVQLRFVESGVIGSAVPDGDRLDKARGRLVAAADDIRAAKFEPKPSAIACGYCPFRTICSASVA
ncbi:MAG TPA: ATP-dependent DNA helicase [Candidatus Limnocylindrales bacterium]